MQQEVKLYHPKDDPIFNAPFIDAEEWRDKPVRHLYVHGGFEGTKARFALYFPPHDKYKGRFFQMLSPVQGDENASQSIPSGGPISFSVCNGAFFVESNMGGDDPDPTMLYRSSAAVAEYSRKVAIRLFGDHRPYGYVYGGSGGGFKTIACVQNTENIWDGSVPFVIGSPMAIPNMFTVRVHAMRLLRDKLSKIIDAVEPGGSGDMYADLNDEEKAALLEITRMGFPPRAWFSYKEIGAGSLPVLTYAIDRMDSSYYTDFWTKPGYLGSDPNGSAIRDRLCFETKAASVIPPQEEYHTDNMDVDKAWQTLVHRYRTDPVLVLESAPAEVRYIEGTKVVITSGDAAGLKLPLKELDGNKAVIGPAFGMGDISELMRNIKPGDGVLLDNSDYIALQTYHRHQVPPTRDYCGWEQFRDENGEPVYPQRPVLIGPIVACSGAGSVQSGRIHGKMIVVASLMDEAALPWHADWYRRKVAEYLGERTDDSFRLWYNDNAMHGGDYSKEFYKHIVSYQGALYQALLDLSAWVEKGIVPPDNTVYTIVDSQIAVPANANERKGVQPVVTLAANGEVKAIVRPGEPVTFKGHIEVPPKAGKVTLGEFDFLGEGNFEVKAELNMLNDGTAADVEAVYIFERTGTYFPALRAASNRNGDKNDEFTQVQNIARVRVIVE